LIALIMVFVAATLFCRSRDAAPPEVRKAIDQVLAALDEPTLGTLQSKSARVTASSSPLARPSLT
jgi:hypothetical protein